MYRKPKQRPYDVWMSIECSDVAKFSLVRCMAKSRAKYNDILPYTSTDEGTLYILCGIIIFLCSTIAVLVHQHSRKSDFYGMTHLLFEVEIMHIALKHISALNR